MRLLLSSILARGVIASVTLGLELAGGCVHADGLDRAAWYVQPRALEPTQVL